MTGVLLVHGIWDTGKKLGPLARSLEGAGIGPVRTIDLDNRAFPLTMDNARAGLKVLVDTQPPTIQLRGLPPRVSPRFSVPPR